MNNNKLRKLVLAALSAALIFLGTYFFKIPFYNGYIHLGDGFIGIAASILPLPFSMTAAAIGGVLSDLLAGYAVYIPATAVCKSLMAMSIGLIMRKHNTVSSKNSKNAMLYTLVAALCAGIINTAGYFLAEIIMYGIAGAVVSLGPNAIQSAAGAVIYILLLPAARRALALFPHGL